MIGQGRRWVFLVFNRSNRYLSNWYRSHYVPIIISIATASIATASIATGPNLFVSGINLCRKNLYPGKFWVDRLERGDRNSAIVPYPR